ncbi:hypothetical protein ACFQPA_13215 [Halomarina halobia]|uniref:Nickel/cobalt efflux system n=1 Tax=Halomarina halobia TaxID=3033386 RepID=A0ABD6A9D9_9EURY|nr:hypothetical protein [Halomarina sp. PSR21]
MFDGSLSVFLGAVVLGLIHGAEPGHGWPIAAAYALDRRRKWLAGLAAGVVIGVGHLVSSVAVVVAFLLAASFFDLGSLGWVRYVAGILLILLGIREYRHGQHDGHAHAHDHDHGGHPRSHGHAHDHGHEGRRNRREHTDGGRDCDHALDADDSRGLWGIASAAFLLGFAHEEEIQILGFCTGAADHCLSLMLTYAVAVIVALVGLTLLLVAGFERYEERVEGYAAYFPTVSAAVLILMGIGFVLGAF